MSTPGPGTGLQDLERRLRELEAELLGEPTAPAPPPAAVRSTWAAPPPVAPSAPTAPPQEPVAPDVPGTADLTAQLAEARADLDELRTHLDGLVRHRERLEAAAGALVADYERLLDRLGDAPVGAGSAAGSPPDAARWPQPVPTPPDRIVLEGTVAVDAGPFADIATLSRFEQALAGIDGVRDVHVRAFAGDRAAVDVVLAAPLALGGAIERVAPVPCRTTAAGAGALTVALGPGAG